MNKKRTNRNKRSFVKILKSSKYGQDLYGTRIYYEGKKPQSIKEDGRFNFGKHILETLQTKFGEKFRLVITKKEDSIKVVKSIHWVRLSQVRLKRMNDENFDKSRDIKLEIVRHVFTVAFPEHFKGTETKPFVPGSLARVLQGTDVAKMSDEDKDAIKTMLPDFVAAESIKSVNLLKAAAQIKTLRELETELREAIRRGHPESWWQTYIKGRILVIQQGYIQAIDKLNVVVGNTKFPDFLLVTHDDYVDILEIKKPDTPLLKHDASRDNYYWDTEMAKAIVQTENYIAAVDRSGSTLRAHLKDKYGLDLQILKPRGIVLAGNGGLLASQKEKDDFRLLSHGLKNITVVTYDELLVRLSNYIHVLESHIPQKGRPKRRAH